MPRATSDTAVGVELTIQSAMPLTPLSNWSSTFPLWEVTVVPKVAKTKPRKKKGMSLRAFIILMTMA